MHKDNKVLQKETCLSRWKSSMTGKGFKGSGAFRFRGANSFRRSTREVERQPDPCEGAERRAQGAGRGAWGAGLLVFGGGRYAPSAMLFARFAGLLVLGVYAMRGCSRSRGVMRHSISGKSRLDAWKKGALNNRNPKQSVPPCSGLHGRPRGVISRDPCGLAREAAIHSGER